jgi:1,4-alpha-glucan branching enzyme
MGLMKKYAKAKNTCRVTFILPKDAAKTAKTVHLVGEFNKWDVHATPMKKASDGSFKTMLELKAGEEHEYRYLIDDHRWETDYQADKTASSVYGQCENSVVVA